jgi:hypothetical protein
MMIPKIYLETTMFSYYHEERPQVEYQELKSQVRRIFDRIHAGEYEPYTSILSTTEIDAEPNAEKRVSAVFPLRITRFVSNPDYPPIGRKSCSASR